MKALGFIETKGLVGNIDATDAMLKAADVEFIGSDTIGAGPVSYTHLTLPTILRV